MKIYVSTCDKYDHLLPGFAWLFNKYWGPVPVDVLGFRTPPSLPDNFCFHQLEPQESKPWTTNMREFFKQQQDSHFLFLFDDYWLREPVSLAEVARMEELVVRHGVAKGDLSNNTNHFQHTAYNKHGFVLATPSANYRTSTQPAIWRRDYMLKLLQLDGSPWQFELSGLATHDTAKIVGPTTPIYSYANVSYKGQCDPYMLCRLTDADLEQLYCAGMLATMPTPGEIKRLRAGV